MSGPPTTPKYSSLNARQGKHVNEIESTLLIAEKFIQERLDEGKKGMVLNKGTNEQIRVNYARAVKTCRRLRLYFGRKGCFSFGICKTCGHYDTRGHFTSPKRSFGKCAKDGKDKHCYDTCSEHTKEGGGFGL